MFAYDKQVGEIMLLTRGRFIIQMSLTNKARHKVYSLEHGF